MTTSEAKRLILFVLASIVAIWLVLIFADDGADQRAELHQDVYKLQVQTIEHLRQDLNDCHTALEVRGHETLFLLPPVSDEAVIKAWKNRKEKQNEQSKQRSF